MTADDLDALAALDAAASAAPWHVLHTNDDMFMGACFVTKNPTAGRIIDVGDYERDPAEVIAACLLQSPEIAISDDQRWDDNAKLIAAVRNALPELLRLARLGLAVES